MRQIFLRILLHSCAMLMFLALVGSAEAQTDLPQSVQALVNRYVEVSLADGRIPHGILSSKSGTDSLVLRVEQPGIEIESRFSWRVVTAIHEVASSRPASLPNPPLPVPFEIDQPPATEKVIPLAPIPPAPVLPDPMTAAAILPVDVVISEPLSLPIVTSVPVVLPELSPFEPTPDLLAFDSGRIVRSLNISATVANWDRDAEVDGLILRVQPLDGFGDVVPVDGNIDVRLATETKLATGGQSVTRDDRFRVTERWSVPIHAVDFDATGTIVKLPFRRFHPERHFDIAPDAIAVARLRLPTVGAFDASDSFVQLRAPNRFRDDLQMHQGRRLLPFEGSPRW